MRSCGPYPAYIANFSGPANRLPFILLSLYPFIVPLKYMEKPVSIPSTVHLWVESELAARSITTYITTYITTLGGN